MRKENTLELLKFMISAGKQLLRKQGHIKDIGIKKKFLTEEDIRIEREIKKIIEKIPGKHKFFGEEENDFFEVSESVWIADPISGTHLFIDGLPHYAIVVSHMTKGKVDFAAVYDPAAGKLYTADEEGLLINNNKINRGQSSKKKIIYAPSYGWKDREQAQRLGKMFAQKYHMFPSQGSFAVNYCLVAEGIFDGVVSLTKDAFPEFAGCFIANQAGLKATNIRGKKDITPNDRVFICGNEEIYKDLLELTRSEVKPQRIK